MNADKVYAETIAKEYVPKDGRSEKVRQKSKKRAAVFTCTFGVVMALMLEAENCLLIQAIWGNHPPPLPC